MPSGLTNPEEERESDGRDRIYYVAHPQHC